VGDNEALRDGWVSEVVELLVRARALQFFLGTGRLLPPSDPSLTGGRGGGRTREEEYLGGAMGLAQELSRYAIRRASTLDAEAVAR
jgi:hypothetical protein